MDSPPQSGLEPPSCLPGFLSVPCWPEAEDPGEDSQPWGMAARQTEEPGPLNDLVNQILPLTQDNLLCPGMGVRNKHVSWEATGLEGSVLPL